MAETKQEATLRDFLDVIFRRKWLIIGIVLLTTVIVAYLKVSKPQVYASGARILVQRGERSDVFSARPQLLSWTEEVSSQIQVILSEAVFERARQVFADSLAARGMTGQLKFNSGAVRADVVGESNVFSIRYVATAPLEARLGCQSVTLAYAAYYRERKTPPAVTDYFTAQINDVLSELSAWQQKKESFLKESNIFGIEGESRLHISKLTTLETELARTRSNISSARLKVENLARHTEMSGDELERSLSLSTSRNDLQTQLMSSIKNALQRERAKREDLLRRYTKQHPEVVACDQQIADLQAQLKNEVVNAYHVEQASLEQLLAKVAALENEVASTRREIDDLTNKESELENIGEKVRILQDKYDTLRKKKNEADIAQASRPEWEVTILQPASQAWPQRTSDYVRLALGPLLSLIVGLGLAFFLESMDHSLKNEAEVEEYLGTRVLASFNEVKDKGKRAA